MHGVAQLDGSAHGTARIVPARFGKTEHRQDAVAVDLAHGTAVACDHLACELLQAEAQLVDLFGVALLTHARVVTQVCKEQGDVAAPGCMPMFFRLGKGDVDHVQGCSAPLVRDWLANINTACMCAAAPVFDRRANKATWRMRDMVLMQAPCIHLSTR
jgi:hypothetical protein